MQEKIQKISPIKRRILQFADNLHISKRKFYLKIGVSRGTLESNTGITEDVLAKFIAEYPEVRLEWLMKGIGPIIKKEDEDKIDKKIEPTISIESMQDSILRRFEEISRENERLKIEIEQMKSNQGKGPGIDDYLLPKEVRLVADAEIGFKKRNQSGTESELEI